MESPDTDPCSFCPDIFLASVFQPFGSEMIILLAVIIIMLFFSALISGSEVAFFSLSPSQLNELRNDETTSSGVIRHLLEIPKRLLATILITNNFINVSIVIISTYFTKELFDFTEIKPLIAFLLQVVVVTALILLAGEILPKVYASQKNIEFARTMAGPLAVLLRIFYPVSSVLVRSTNLIDRRLRNKGHDISMSELSDAFELTSDESTSEEDRKILKGIVKFGDIEVREIMKARIDVVAAEIGTPFEQLLKIILESGFSRIPVYEESFDKVKGILYIKDLLPFLDKKEGFAWQSLLREPFFIPENKKISDLLQEFREKKIHMAVVVDEYGGTSGVVTLEDVIEEIVGEIVDEYDVSTDEVRYRQIDKNTFIFEGKTSLNDFCKIIGVDDRIFEKVKGDADTLAGLILELLGKIPVKDESITYLNFIFTVRAVDQRRIKSVEVKHSKYSD